MGSDYLCLCIGRIIAGKISGVDVLDCICIFASPLKQIFLLVVDIVLALVPVKCILQYALELVSCILVELLLDPPIARAHYRALFSCRFLFFSYFRTMLTLIMSFTICYYTYCTSVVRKYVLDGYPATKEVRLAHEKVAHSAPYDTFMWKSKLHLFLFYNYI